MPAAASINVHHVSKVELGEIIRLPGCGFFMRTLHIETHDGQHWSDITMFSDSFEQLYALARGSHDEVPPPSTVPRSRDPLIPSLDTVIGPRKADG